MKLFSSIITGFLMLFVSAAVFFMALVALNGFSEKQATPGLIFLLVAQLLIVLGSALLAGRFCPKLQAKFSWKPWLAAILGVLLAMILGTLLSGVALFSSVLIVSL